MALVARICSGLEVGSAQDWELSRIAGLFSAVVKSGTQGRALGILACCWRSLHEGELEEYLSGLGGLGRANSRPQSGSGLRRAR